MYIKHKNTYNNNIYNHMSLVLKSQRDEEESGCHLNLMSPWVGASQSAFASSVMQIHPFKLKDSHSLA